MGAKFRRPCRIENRVVDFYGFDHRLAIELEGGVHWQPRQRRKDNTKEDYLRTLGIRLLRIANGMVLEDPGEFVRKVREATGRGRAGWRLDKQGTPHLASFVGHPLPRERAGILSSVPSPLRLSVSHVLAAHRA